MLRQQQHVAFTNAVLCPSSNTRTRRTQQQSSRPITSLQQLGAQHGSYHELHALDRFEQEYYCKLKGMIHRDLKRRQYSNCKTGAEDPKELEQKISLVQAIGRSGRQACRSHALLTH